MAAVSSVLIGAALAASAGSAIHQVEQSRTARKKAERETNDQKLTARRMEDKQVEKEKVADTQAAQMKKRERMRAMAGRATGRQSTILGGAGDVGNAGNQAQAGAGKTLLGV